MKKFMPILLTAVLLLSQSFTIVHAAPRPADVSKASSGNVLLGVPGKFEKANKTAILKRINQIRKEACDKGYPNPDTGEKLTSSDYVPMKWSSDMEWIAQLRAAECTVYESHTRPNQTSCFTVSHNGENSWAENLAWNDTGLMEGIEQWYDEKNDWVNQRTNKVTGHYTSMIDPNYRYVGIGSFARSSGGWNGVSAEFSFHTGLDEKQSGLSGKKIQTIEVSSKHVGKAKLNAPSSIKKGKSKTLTVTQKISFPDFMGGKSTTVGRYLGKITWKSSKPHVIAITQKGKITAKKNKKSKITAKLANKKTLRKTIAVK